jgi:hypothetical protein
LAVKDGVGRFVKYVRYPYWARSSDMPDKFTLKVKPPEDVVRDVELFIQGKVTFSDGKRGRIIRTLLGGAPGSRDGGTVSFHARRTTNVGEHFQPDEWTGGTGVSGLPDETKRNGKTRKVHGDGLPGGDLSKSRRAYTGICAITGREQTVYVDTGEIVPQGHVDSKKLVED